MGDWQQPQVLVVDDDEGLRDLLRQYLGNQGFDVRLAEHAMAMDVCLAEALPDVLVLDLMMPGEDGLSVARRLKANGCRFPIIMLSARGDDIDRIVGLEIGADDYLPKPFNPRELTARLRALLRRVPAPGDAAGAVVVEDARHISRFADFELDLDAQRLSRAGEPVNLTSAEFALLQVFVAQPNTVLSRDQLMDALKGYERDPFDRSIDVRVTRLRRKIEPNPTDPVYIRTIWGQGYLFAPKGMIA